MPGGEASAFYSQETAEEAVQYALDHGTIVEDTGAVRVLVASFPENIGYVYDRNGTRTDTNIVRVVERILPNGTTFILTAYPVTP
uniref:Bacterial CdiA-CT RNAse A domain-containing protein n=1 Tax=Thermogemmatispora argillosa TaxID=2045280 RepID=A0A455T0K0_9CHLR|nr:hypothetical protein KTA_15450 [Thermogemmatispora argillosa]